MQHLEQSRSQRILWLLEELGVPYELKQYPRINGLAPPELKNIHPMGKSPVITDDGLVIAESGTIIAYLLKKYGNGRFQVIIGGQQEIDDLYYQHFAEGSLMLYLVNKAIFLGIQAKSPFFIRPIANIISDQINKALLDPSIQGALETTDQTLKKDGGRQWLAGGSEPTAADFMMSFPLEAMIYGGRMPSEQIPEAIKKYVERIQARPAYARGLEKDPSYKYTPRQGKL